ncbi:MAG: hypothetical protein A3B23_00165 [Candidatus Colwellbacteria bacterium RIFCSPLOWO2_01_FULL_48_10]|uniref:Uncharacterized protein n=1 Tax=Candidatus Colwellbacteria bacterium RIFCSPLOWO2_01_FULL_48_10 TaxID=1797690 RepID=A0A1G1Z7Z6_9BACT|nr:MAG: hypothetical protein A3B23_00165 [Candidatus Colwellbacteria bacterium RIFCSPLOWO2_01_FULL_48_10]
MGIELSISTVVALEVTFLNFIQKKSRPWAVGSCGLFAAGLLAGSLLPHALARLALLDFELRFENPAHATSFAAAWTSEK